MYGLSALLGSKVIECYYPETSQLAAAALALSMTLLVNAAFFGYLKVPNLTSDESQKPTLFESGWRMGT